MRRWINFVLRIGLRVLHRLWRLLPQKIKSILRPSARKLRSKIGGAKGSPYKKVLEETHSLVRIIPPLPKFVVEPAPVQPSDFPEVSVIVTAHNDGAFLDTCLWSIRRQDILNWECIVVDDASVDDSIEIALKHAEGDRRFRVIRRDRNVGLAVARNTGIDSARGEFLTFLDGDDFMFPNTLGTRIEAAKDGNPLTAGSWCDWNVVSEPSGLGFLPSTPGKSFTTIDYLTGGGENQVISTSPLVRRDVVKSLDGYDNSFRTAEDFDFNTRLFRNGYRLKFSKVVGVAYRQKRSSMVSGDPHGHAQNAMKVYSYMKNPMCEESICVSAPAPYRLPPLGIPSEVKRIERLVSFLTFAVLLNDEEQIKKTSELFPPGLIGASSFLLDVDGRIDVALRRHQTRTTRLSRQDGDRIKEKVKELIAVRGRESDGTREESSHRGEINQERLERLKESHSRIRGSIPMSAAGVNWDVLLVAKSADAVRELLLVGRELVEAGKKVAMLDNGDAVARRAMLAEGVHRVAVPVSDPKLLISSTGSAGGVDPYKHMVIACEPTVQPPLADAKIDVAHVRGAWEVEQFEGLKEVKIVGWHSRLDRLRTALSPIDGQGKTVRGEDILVLAAGATSGLEKSDLEEALPGNSLLFTPEFMAVSGITVGLDEIRLIAPALKAVVCVGPNIPAEPLAYGIPIFVISEELKKDTTGIIYCKLETLSQMVDAIGPLTVPEPLDVDPLSLHVEAALHLLDEQ
jgi:GT2 family glycosyltransferase